MVDLKNLRDNCSFCEFYDGLGPNSSKSERCSKCSPYYDDHFVVAPIPWIELWSDPRYDY